MQMRNDKSNYLFYTWFTLNEGKSFSPTQFKRILVQPMLYNKQIDYSHVYFKKSHNLLKIYLDNLFTYHVVDWRQTISLN
jgi:hypothetical protein